MKKFKKYNKPLIIEIALDFCVSVMMVSEGSLPDPNSPWGASQAQESDYDIFKSSEKYSFSESPFERSPFK